MKPPSDSKKTNPIQTQSKPVLSAVEWANFPEAKMSASAILVKGYENDPRRQA